MKKTTILLFTCLSLFAADDKKATPAPVVEKEKPNPVKAVTGEEKIQWLDMMRDYDTLAGKQKDIQNEIDTTPAGKEMLALQKQLGDLTAKSQKLFADWQASHNATGCPITRSIDWDLANCPKK